MAITSAGGILIKSMYVNNGKDAQEILSAVDPSRGDSYAVMVGSTEVGVESDREKQILSDLLSKCIQNRYVPWVGIYQL